MFKRTNLMSRLAAAAVLSVAAGAALAQSDTPVGLWKSVDDESKQPKALIRIVEQGGQLLGRIEKILTDKPDAVCDQCGGELKDKPIRGMAILRGHRKGGDFWEGGTILDPANGKTYKSHLKLIEGGAKLEVRGYIGTPILGRTQTWLREAQ